VPRASVLLSNANLLASYNANNKGKSEISQVPLIWQEFEQTGQVFEYHYI